MQKTKILQLKSGKEQSLLRYHPWIFSGAVKNDLKEFTEGEIVEVRDSKNNLIGFGHFQKASIAVRMLSFGATEINQGFWNQKIKQAFDFRKSCQLANNDKTNCYRLIFGEGDHLPGLIIDNYNGHFVMQCHSSGMYQHRIEIAEALKTVFVGQINTIYNKSKENLHAIGGKEIQNEYLLGSTKETMIKENDHVFKVNWESGQKTGFFIDQRENRNLVGEYSKGRKVLNTFSYTGGFSVYAGNNACQLIHSVDASKGAIELCRENMALNNISNEESFVADTFDFLKDKKDFYDLIILDPPAFAKSRDAKHQAFKGYKRLNKLALEQIKNGGWLFTFSCSQVVDKNLFASTVMSAAIESKRKVKIARYLNQPCDHPVNIFHPEGEYLKGLLLYVD